MELRSLAHEKHHIIFYMTIKIIPSLLLDGEKLELLHENAGYHMQLKEQRERRKNLFVNGPYSRPMLARQEIAIR